MRHGKQLVLAALLTSLAMLAAACGGGDGGGVSGPSGGGGLTGGKSPVVNAGTPQPGGVMKWASVGQFDHLDPGAAYTVTYFAFIARGGIRALTTYAASTDYEEQQTTVPDLADSLGEANEDNTEWTYHLKEGLTYGPALGGKNVPGVTGQPITSMDIKYGIERLFNPNVGAGYAVYYEDLVGAKELSEGKAKTISGIETPDPQTIVFKFDKPIGDVDYRMSLPGSSPVPQKFASKLDKANPSKYEQNVVFTGPYYVAEYVPEQEVVLKRNPNWDPATDEVRKAYVDEVQWKEGFNTEVCIDKVISNEYDLAVDCTLAGPQLQKVVQTPELKARFFNGPEACTAYLFINETVPPFDDVKVRQALNYAIDKNALLRVIGGKYAGEPAASVLPPGMIGALPAAEYHPFGTSPNIEKAKELIADSSAADFNGTVSLVGDSSDPGPKLIESVRSDLAAIGIEAEVKQLKYPDYYTKYYQEPSSKTALGLAAWCQDYPSPVTFLKPLLYGPAILPHANSNYSMTDDPELNAAIEKAETLAGAEAEEAWAEANRIATEIGAWVPWRWYRAKLLSSDRVVNMYYHSYYDNLDWVNAGVEQ